MVYLPKHIDNLFILLKRKHSYFICGYQDSRDGNASKNILALGLDGQQETARSSRLQARE
jgi:transposase